VTTAAFNSIDVLRATTAVGAIKRNYGGTADRHREFKNVSDLLNLYLPLTTEIHSTFLVPNIQKENG
jgi:hypothetical protein